jgi:hypothetical protein
MSGENIRRLFTAGSPRFPARALAISTHTSFPEPCSAADRAAEPGSRRRKASLFQQLEVNPLGHAPRFLFLQPVVDLQFEDIVEAKGVYMGNTSKMDNAKP